MRLLNEAAGTTQLFAAKKVRLVEAFLWKMSGTKSDALKVCCTSSGTKLDDEG